MPYSPQILPRWLYVTGGGSDDDGDGCGSIRLGLPVQLRNLFGRPAHRTAQGSGANAAPPPLAVKRAAGGAGLRHPDCGISRRASARSVASFDSFGSINSSSTSSSVSLGDVSQGPSDSGSDPGLGLHASAASETSDGIAPSEDEPRILLWRRVPLTQYMPAVPAFWRWLLGRLRFAVVVRPSNDASLGLKGWRSGVLLRRDLVLPVLLVVDAPGQAAPGEGFDEWPLCPVFKTDLRALYSWADYLASLRRADRWNVKTRTKLFQSFESEGRLRCQVVRLGPEAFDGESRPPPPAPAPPQQPQQVPTATTASSGQPLWTTQVEKPPPPPQQQQQAKQIKHGKKRAGSSSPGGCDAAAAVPPQLSFVTPGSVAEAEELVSELWGLYEQTGARNGFTECRRSQFERLIRQAPDIHAVVVREGSSGCGPVLAFGLLLPHRECLQVLYTGLKYDSPLVLSVGLQVALAHNETVRQQRTAANSAAAAAKMTEPSVADVKPLQANVAASSGGVIFAHADGTMTGVAAAAAAKAAAPRIGSPPPPPSLGPRVGLIEFLDLGPGRRFVKEHLGAVGHPVSMYTRGVFPLSQALARYLLSRYLEPRTIINDP
ncbi:hypothetical protein PLESTM_000177900 [Pleodorina starrii]|nr:hypothetical protein PLESTM_000177900 [Pleodorina starrii]